MLSARILLMQPRSRRCPSSPLFKRAAITKPVVSRAPIPTVARAILRSRSGPALSPKLPPALRRKWQARLTKLWERPLPRRKRQSPVELCPAIRVELRRFPLVTQGLLVIPQADRHRWFPSLPVGVVAVVVSSQQATKRAAVGLWADALRHDLFVEEAAFGRGFDVTSADGEIAKSLAFLALRGVAADDRGEFVDNVFRLHRRLVEFVEA